MARATPTSHSAHQNQIFSQELPCVSKRLPPHLVLIIRYSGSCKFTQLLEEKLLTHHVMLCTGQWCKQLPVLTSCRRKHFPWSTGYILMYQSRQEPKGNIFKGMKGDWRNFLAHSKRENIFFLYVLFPAEPVSNSSGRSTGANSNSRSALPPHGGAASSCSVSLKPRQIRPRIKWKHVILSEKTPAPFFVPLLMWKRRPVLI